MAQRHDSSHPDGVADDGNGGEKPSDDLVRARERKGIAAFEAYSRLRSWPMVAELVGYPSGRAARVAAERALEAEFKESPRSQEFMRHYASKHLDLLMRSAAAKAANPKDPEHLAAVKVIRELIAQQSKLLGLDAPTKVSLVDPTTQQIEEYLDREMGPRHIESEGDLWGDDIVDGEVVEPDELEA